MSLAVISQNIDQVLKILVYNTVGQLVDIPSILSCTFNDVVDGGSADGNFVVPRRFVDTGLLGYEFRVDVFLADSVNPWYTGRITSFDPEQLQNEDFEYITVYTYGYQNRLGFAIIDGTGFYPGLQPNGTVNAQITADQALQALLSNYLDTTTFGTSYINAGGIDLEPMTFDNTGLNTAIDTIVKQITNDTGNTYEWFVRAINGGKPALVVQPEQNPNLVTSGRIAPTFNTVPVEYLFDWKDSTIADFKIHNTSDNLINMIALYGGNDPNTGITVYGAFQDSTSISLYALRQQKVTNQYLTNASSLSNYATAYLLLNANPQPQGQYLRLIPTDSLRAGKWVQIALPNVGTASQEIQQVRCVKVTLQAQRLADKVEQVAQTLGPLPYIDKAIYSAINQSQNASSIALSAPSTSLKSLYLYGGFDWTAVSNPGGVGTQISTVHTPPSAVFNTPSSSPVYVSLPPGSDGGNYAIPLVDAVTGV